MKEILSMGNPHLLSMNNNSELELKNKITNWLLEEGVTFSQTPDENADFRLRLTWGFIIDLVKVKATTRLVSTATMSFMDEKTTKAFSKLTKKDRSKFFYDLQSELVKFPIGYGINPNTQEKLDTIDFHYTFYIEDLTKTSLFTSLDTIRRAMLCTSGFSNNRLEIDMATPTSSDNKAGVA